MSYDNHIINLNKDKKLEVGDFVKVLIDYSLFTGTVLKVNKKSISVSVNQSFGCLAFKKNFKYEKVLKFGTNAVLVWELWKGKNGRGGYRLDTIMYQDQSEPVENIKPSTYIYENDFPN